MGIWHFEQLFCNSLPAQSSGHAPLSMHDLLGAQISCGEKKGGSSEETMVRVGSRGQYVKIGCEELPEEAVGAAQVLLVL